MSNGDAVGALVSALDAAGIPYMITGSIASAHHGVSRATQDVDIVVASGRRTGSAPLSRASRAPGTTST